MQGILDSVTDRIGKIDTFVGEWNKVLGVNLNGCFFILQSGDTNNAMQVL